MKLSAENSYSFGTPGLLVWLSHIGIGLYFLYLGYHMVRQSPLTINHGIILVILGSMAALYHAHIMFINYYYGSEENEEH